MKKALVISGGGSKGAFAGGVAEYLLKEKKIPMIFF
jgi:predicted patatin/cPLA2 family phospholipase